MKPLQEPTMDEPVSVKYKTLLLGEAIKCIRWYHFKMASEVARELDVSGPYLCYLESGKKEVKDNFLRKFAHLFEFKVVDIKAFAAELRPDDSPVQKVSKYLNHVVKGGV